MMASILLAAGVFTGIMQGSGMLKAMAQAAVTFVPADMARLAQLGADAGIVGAADLARGAVAAPDGRSERAARD